MKNYKKVYDRQTIHTGPTYISSRIDSEVGASNIANLFAQSYNNLFNNVKNGVALDSVQNKIQELDHTSISQVDRINEKLIKTAL